MASKSTAKKVSAKVWILIGVIAVVVIAAIIVVCLFVCKKKTPANTVQTPQKQSQENAEGITGPVDMVKAFEGLSKEELQAAYDECVKHPEISKEQFDCQVILNLIKYKK